MDPDPRPLLVRQLAEDLVVQVHERVQQPARRVQLERQARLGEVDLDVRPAIQATADLGGGLTDEVLDERLARVARQAVTRVQQAQRRGGDDRLLQGCLRVGSRGVDVRPGLRRVTEGAGRQERELAGVAVLERNRHPSRREVRESGDRIRRETLLALLAVGHHRRPGLLETTQGVSHGVVIQGLEGGRPEQSLARCSHAVDQLRRARDTADRFGGKCHVAYPTGTVMPLDRLFQHDR